MSLDRAINILVTITLIEMMVLVGLQVTFTELAQAAKNWWLLARAAMANYVLFPAVTTALLMLFDVGPMSAVVSECSAPCSRRNCCGCCRPGGLLHGKHASAVKFNPACSDP